MIPTCDKCILLAEKDLHLLQTKLLGMKLMSKKIWWGREVLLLIDWLMSPVIFFPVKKIHKACSQIFTKPWNNASMSKPKKIIWVLVLRLLETCICSKTDAKKCREQFNKTSHWGFRYWIWKLVNLLQNHETRWVSTRGVKQVKWVSVLRFHISKKLTL